MKFWLFICKTYGKRCVVCSKIKERYDLNTASTWIKIKKPRQIRSTRSFLLVLRRKISKKLMSFLLRVKGRQLGAFQKLLQCIRRKVLLLDVWGSKIETYWFALCLLQTFFFSESHIDNIINEEYRVNKTSIYFAYCWKEDKRKRCYKIRSKSNKFLLLHCRFLNRFFIVILYTAFFLCFSCSAMLMLDRNLSIIVICIGGKQIGRDLFTYI